MENRKYKDTEDILEFVKSKWKLSIQEETVLEGILHNFSAQNKEEIDKLDYLINDETELLLNLLSSYEIENYACEQFDLISKKWEGDLVDALHDLDYDFSEKMLETAKGTAKNLGVANVSFEYANALTFQPRKNYDAYMILGLFTYFSNVI